MNADAVVQAVLAVLGSLGAIAGAAGRRRRLRVEIREDLQLVKELQQEELLLQHTPAVGWLLGKITVDVAKLSGHQLGTPKKPIPWGSVIFALLLAAASATWLWWVVRGGYVWYTVLLPATLLTLLLISVLGMTTNREQAPAQDEVLPPGATPLRDNDRPDQRLRNGLAMADAIGTEDRFAPENQVGAVYEFLRAMREGRYEEGLRYADQTWILCRIQAWLWNHSSHFGGDVDQLEPLALSLLEERQPSQIWADFVETEVRAFTEGYANVDPDDLGAASHPRRIGPGYELVILAPIGDTGGFFVTGATPLPRALTFVVHQVGDRWQVASHLGTAPPQPGWPPVWWSELDERQVQAPAAEDSGEDSAHGGAR